MLEMCQAKGRDGLACIKGRDGSFWAEGETFLDVNPICTRVEGWFLIFQMSPYYNLKVKTN